MKTTTLLKPGYRSERLEVIARAPNRPNCSNSWWTCRCDCGTVKDIKSSSLTGKTRTQSCGCFRREQKQRQLRTHGQCGTKAYQIWRGMRQRCECPKSKGYHNYGGRGIVVCESWRKFETFLADMGQPPPGLTLEREDNDGPYSPDNCVWATKSAQARNRRSNRLLTVDGVTLPVSAWAERNRVPFDTIIGRLARGFSDSDAVAPHSFRGRNQTPAGPRQARRNLPSHA